MIRGFKNFPLHKKRRIMNGERCLKARCNHGLPEKPSYGYMFDQVSDEMRNQIFLEFLALPNWIAKKIYVRGLKLNRKPTLRKKSNEISDIKKRDINRDCFLVIDNNQQKRVRVCRKFFLATLDISEDMLSSWTQLDENFHGKKPKATNSNEKPCIKDIIEKENKLLQIGLKPSQK